MDACMESFLLHCHAKNLSARTLEWYNSCLLAAGEFWGWPSVADLTSEMIESFIRDQLARCSPFTAASRLRAVAAFLNWCERTDIIVKNPMRRVEKLKLPKRRPKTISDKDLAALLDATDTKTLTGLRDRAMLLLFVDTGLRCSELRLLTVDRLNMRDGAVIVIGKGNRERKVHFASRARQALLTYLRAKQQSNWSDVETLFPSENTREALTVSGVQSILARLSRRAGLTYLIGAHRLRHTAATKWLELGGDVITLQERLGHSSLETTRIYVNQREDVLKEKAERFSPAASIDVPNRPRIRMPKKKF